MPPLDIVDPHFHFLDPEKNEFQAFLRNQGAGSWSPEQYKELTKNLPISSGVYVEALPDDGFAEASWVSALRSQGRCNVDAIVANCFLAGDQAEMELDRLRTLPLVRGIRYILDYDGGPPDGQSPTHVNMKKHNGGKGVDFLRNGEEAAKFERGVALLEARGLSFDLQCAPTQLPAAAALFSRHPGIPVCLDHLGKPHRLAANGGGKDKRKLAEWRAGMKVIAKLPQVYVKLSMLGYAVPGWHEDAKKEALLRSLVREVIGLFGAHRCMFASNYHINDSVSDSDGIMPTGPTVEEMYAKFTSWVADLPQEDQDRLFSGSAKEFYRLGEYAEDRHPDRNITDPHIHFLNVEQNDFQVFLKNLGAQSFSPEQYQALTASLPIKSTVYVEALPDDGLAEAQWVSKLVEEGRCKVQGIVANCFLGQGDVEEKLDLLKALPLVRGIRYILDYDSGPHDGKNPTHANMKKHNEGQGFDFLRDDDKAEAFEQGLAKLEERDLSFDLQCAPAQLPAAAALFGRYPKIPVCIDHLGKPHRLAGDGSLADERKLTEWRAGMQLMAQLPQVYVKLSMLGYAVPGWHESKDKEKLLRDLVREVIDLFGARRCMFASNYHINDTVSDSDGNWPTGPPLMKVYSKYLHWVADLSPEEQDRLFGGSAREFYRLGEYAPGQKHATHDYDLFVIGGGSGGLVAAKAAAGLGAKVGVADFVKPSPAGTTWGLGGTCVNAGCIPKKLMHLSSLFREAQDDYSNLGWATRSQHRWSEMVTKVDDHIRSLNDGARSDLRSKEVTYHNAFATFVDAHTIQLVDKEGKESQVTFKTCVVACGGRPSLGDYPGAEECCISADDIFWRKTPPGKTLVVGASSIALECAGLVAGFGFDTSVMVRSILLRGFDQDIAEMIGEYMQKKGVKFERGVVPSKFEKTESGQVRVFVDDKEFGVYDTVLMAVGRRGGASELNAAAAGLSVLENSGKLVVDQAERTSVPHIFAIGDVIDGRPELTPVAIQAGRYLARRLFAFSRKLMDYRDVATTIFTPIEYGTAGYSEEEAKSKLGQDRVKVYHTAASPLEWGLSQHRAAAKDTGYMKILCDTLFGERVIGVHILGPNAGEVVQGLSAAMKAGITKEQLDDTVGIHPTFAEACTTMTEEKVEGKEAAKGGC